MPTSIVIRGRTARQRTAFAARTVARVAACTLLVVATARADEIRVITSGAFSTTLREVVPEFERATRNKVVTASGTSMGNAPDSIPNRLNRGEPADVVILASTALDELIAQGKVVAGSRVDLVRSSIGMAVRAGAPRPDISSVEALKRCSERHRSPIRRAPVVSIFPRSCFNVSASPIRSSARASGSKANWSAPASHAVTPRSDSARALIGFLVSSATAPAIRKNGLKPSK